MSRLEERIREEYKNMILPDTDMAERVREIVSSDRTKNGRNSVRTGNTRIIFRRIAAAAVIAVSVLCASVTIYAAVKGLTVKQMILLIWGDDEPGRIDETISCEAGIESETNSFSNLDIRPVRVIGDVRGLYVVLKVTDNNGYSDASTDVLSFGDYEMEFSDGGSASYSLLLPGENVPEEEVIDGSRYIALEYIGGDDGKPVCESGEFTLHIKDWCSYSSVEEAEEAEEGEGKLIEAGEYNTVISYNYASDNVSLKMKDTGYSCDVSALTVTVNTDDGDSQAELINNEEIILKLKDGSSVKAEVEYGLESEGTYTVIYVIKHPIKPSEVVGCEIIHQSVLSQL